MPEFRPLGRLRTHFGPARRRAGGERGFALIEVMVSAALLVVVAGGVLGGIDGPQQVSGRNQARSTASALAQQDQERMRSMPISSLVGYTTTRTVPVAGVNWSVYSRVIWVRDANDTDSCIVPGDDTSGDYLKITSRAWTGTVTPVELSSLLTPPPGSVSNTKGTLAVHITDQLDNPVVGQSVTIAGPNNMTTTTNTAGCAVFGLVDQGTYTVTFSRGGWVDPSSVQNVSASTSVTARSTTVLNKNYAQSGRINVSVDTQVGAAAPVASPAKAVTVANGGIPAGTITWPAPATPAQGSSSFALDVYPFPSGYGVWAGACAAGNPTLYGLPPVTAAPTPGGAVAVTVRQPSITVSGNPGSFATNTHVVYTSIDSGCNEKRSQNTTAPGGVMPYPGMPYGNFKLCADSGGTYSQRNSFLNNVANGQSTTIPFVGSGTCP